MKRIAILFLIVLTLGSCGMGRHVSQHGAMNKTGAKAHKDAQDRLTGQFGGPNFKRPNHFKKRHFPKRLTSDLLRDFECPEYIPTACSDTTTNCI